MTSPYHTNKSCLEVESENKNSENGKYINKMKIEGLLKFCPTCRCACIKYNGCHKMLCSVCGENWCWLCLSSNIDYDHYNINKEGCCSGKLWEGLDENGNNII